MCDIWSNIKPVGLDPIFSTDEAFRNDTHSSKISLVIGIYRDNEGLPYMFPVVDKVEKLLLEQSHDKEYLPVAGLDEFNEGAKKLVFGNQVISDNVCTVQALSGAGALFLACRFIANQYSIHTKLLIPDPTWTIHFQIFEEAGLHNHINYPYYDSTTKKACIDQMLSFLDTQEDGSAILLQACAQNPTGADPTNDQWEQILQMCIKKKFFPIFDFAYQGFASGNVNTDAYSIRLFYKAGIPLMVCHRFSLIAGIYGERVGALHLACHSKELTYKVKSSICKIIRSIYSNPPLHGALIMATILNDKQLYDEWTEQLATISKRMKDMRMALRCALEELKTPGDWSHITDQIGMFSYIGLSTAQCARLISKHHIYLLLTGRISISKLNTGNVKHVAEAIHEVMQAIY